MRNPVKITNLRTGVEFTDINANLLAYAKSDTATFLITYEEVEAEETPEVYSEESLKAMSMKDLQAIADSMELECDRRRKDALIDGILKRG